MSSSTTLYLIAGIAGIISLAAWGYWIVAPTWHSYVTWWERLTAMLLSVYVLAAMIFAGGALGVAILFYSDSI